MTSEVRTYSRYQVRGSQEYKAGLFPEGPTGHTVIDFLFRNLAAKKIHGKFEYFAQSSIGMKSQILTPGSINQKTGGLIKFFQPGETLLDLGCGVGVAAGQMQAEFPDIRVIAMDKGLGTKLDPIYRKYGDYIGGDWNKLPFKDNTFTRILAVESFPKHADWIWGFKDTFKDITRISQLGTIWRGTHSSFNATETVAEDDWKTEMVQSMKANGWEVFINKRIFIAKLVHK